MRCRRRKILGVPNCPGTKLRVGPNHVGEKFDLTRKYSPLERMISLRIIISTPSFEHDLGRHADPPQTDINADAGVIQARGVLDRLYQEGQAAAKKVAAE